MKLIGIDVGAAGGMAVYDNGEIELINMPDSDEGIIKFFKEHQDYKIFCENVGSNGVYGSGTSSSAGAHFARHRGFLDGTMKTLGIDVEFVSPQTWMKTVTNKKSKDFDSKSAWKNHLKDKAKALYPDQKPTLKTADALLIMHYGIQKENDKMKNEKLF